MEEDNKSEGQDENAKEVDQVDEGYVTDEELAASFGSAAADNSREELIKVIKAKMLEILLENADENDLQALAKIIKEELQGLQPEQQKSI